MKKLYTSAKLMGITVALSFSQFLNAQVTVDFEANLSQVDTFWNNSNAAGPYVESDVTFSINYDSTFMSWDGFALSSMRDDTTAGYGNQYSSYSGDAYSGLTYGVYFPGFGAPNYIEHQSDVQFDGFWVNNSTYAALSMRDGDMFAKQFGSPNGPDGQPDGTNGEDWFLLSVFVLDALGNQLDSTGIYLADYRFSDPQDDYILDQWTYVDLSGLSAGRKLGFDLTSSDVGQFGMNTPAYFVIDDLTIDGSLSIQENELQLATVYPNPASESFRIKGGDYDEIRIRDLNGRLVQVMNGVQNDISILRLNSGIYLVETYSNNRIQSRTKLIKQ